MPAHLLWFRLPDDASATGPTVADRHIVTTGESVNRRELLRVMSLAGSLLALPATEQLDVERLTSTDRGTVGAVTLDEYDRLNGRLWDELSRSPAKRTLLPLVRQQLDVLTGHLRSTQPSRVRLRLCGLVGDLLQLCGEILFDSNSYDDAAHCYALAANASKEAGHVDLWACAMIRHAFIGVYERRFDHVVPLLDGAEELARRGDPALPTRHWVAAVRAQAFAGIGDPTRCRRSMDSAALVTDLGRPEPTGWLRFTDARLAEERGSCFVELGRPELAEPALREALARPLSVRRRGGVLADLATVGVQSDDAEQVVLYGNAAVDAARQTASTGYLGRKLSALQPRLRPWLADRHVRSLDREITTLTAAR